VALTYCQEGLKTLDRNDYLPRADNTSIKVYPSVCQDGPGSELESLSTMIKSSLLVIYWVLPRAEMGAHYCVFVRYPISLQQHRSQFPEDKVKVNHPVFMANLSGDFPLLLLSIMIIWNPERF
jgi:hypothetical protein